MAGITKTTNIDVSIREVDFVTQFSRNWDALREILGIMRPIKKTPGTKLTSYRTSVTLENGDVAEGETIPFSQANIKPVAFGDIDIKKYGKSVTVEAVAKYGAAVAVVRTDEEFRNELQSKVMTDFYNFLKTGTLVDAKSTWQMAFAMAQGLVRDKFKRLRRDVTDIVQFVNILDVYEYLGAKDISVQTRGGMNYLQDFMGAKAVIMTSDIERGTVIAVPVNNIDLYYIDPSDSQFAQLGLPFTVQGETNLIGFHTEGKYSNMTGESYALMGMKLWAEYLDGIAVVSVNAQDMTPATVSEATAESYWGTARTAIQNTITVTGDKITGTLHYLTSGALVNDWGAGNFLAVKFSNFSSGVTYGNVKVGLVPSQGAGMQTLDSDQDAVMKITDKDAQKLKVVQTYGDKTYTQYFDLSGLTLEGAE